MAGAFDVFRRPDAADTAGSAFAPVTAQQQLLNYNTLAGRDEAWRQAEGSPWKSAEPGFLARLFGHPATQSLLNAANFIGPGPKMPARPAGRDARATALGYSSDKFFRGEASGRLPESYEGAFFSRDPEYAGGFAKRGGQEAPREFRLNLTNAFRDYEPVNAATYARIIEAVKAENPKLAQEMVTAITDNPAKGVDWFAGFAKARPDQPVAESGAHIRQMLDVGTNGSAKDVFKRAGYDALDYGRDVEKISGDGIRLANAKFDPAKASSRNIMAGVTGATALPAIASRYSEENY
jgi:hypothetical protein